MSTTQSSFVRSLCVGCTLLGLVATVGCKGSDGGGGAGGGGHAGSGGVAGGGSGGSGGQPGGMVDMTPPSGPPGQLPDMISPAPGDMVSVPGSGDMSAGAGGGGGGGGTGGGLPPPDPSCKYPDAPYGYKENDTIDPNMEGFVCLKPGETTGPGVKMTIKDFFDCNGSRKINALFVDISAGWCGACQEECDNMEKKYSDEHWDTLGVLPVVILGEGYDETKHDMPTIDTCIKWVKDTNLKRIWVCAVYRPKLTNGALPFNNLIDPRNMKIMKQANDIKELDIPALAKKNGGMP